MNSDIFIITAQLVLYFYEIYLKKNYPYFTDLILKKNMVNYSQNNKWDNSFNFRLFNYYCFKNSKNVNVRFEFQLEYVCLGSYHVECTGSRPITEVKQRRARLVLGWVTAWEYRVF